MPDEYVVRLNRRDGSLEISGPDKEWIDAKLKELAVVIESSLPPATEAEQPGGGSGSSSDKAGPKPPKPRRATSRSGGRVQTNPEVEKAMTAEARKGLDAWV